MKDSTGTARDEATARRVEEIVDEAWATLRPKLMALVLLFVRHGVSPEGFLQFEWSLFGLVRDLGRDLLERVVNSLEGEGPLLSQEVLYDDQVYRRLGKKTRNAFVATLFGTICVWRFPYRFWDRQIPQGCIFPLELALGLIEGVTPALTEQLGKYLADGGVALNAVTPRCSVNTDQDRRDGLFKGVPLPALGREGKVDLAVSATFGDRTGSYQTFLVSKRNWTWHDKVERIQNSARRARFERVANDCDDML